MADNQDVQQQLITEFSALAHRHVTVSYILIGVMFVMFTVMGLGGYVGLKMYQNALGKAEQVEQQYNADRNAWQQQIAQDQAERQQLEKEAATRDKAAAKQKQEVAKITDPSSAVAALQNEYHNTLEASVSETDGRVGFVVPDVNRFTQTKIDADTAAKDNATLQAEVDSLKLDVAKGAQTLQECQGTVQAYKKAAKRSKWQKIVHGVEVGGLMLLSAAAGHVI